MNQHDRDNFRDVVTFLHRRVRQLHSELQVAIDELEQSTMLTDAEKRIDDDGDTSAVAVK